MAAPSKKLAALYDESPYQGGCWPTWPQQLLLRAALLDAPAASEAWSEWQEAAEIDALDMASWNLIPLAYVNLKRLGLDDAVLRQARDVYRRQWMVNQQLFFKCAEFVKKLNERGVPAVVVKGVALAHLYHPDNGCRAMADLDVLVPAGKFVELGRDLLKEGWEGMDGYSFDEYRLDEMPSYGFQRADGFSVDIHSHLLHASLSPDADDDFWEHAKRWELRDTPCLTLSAEDHLLHVVSHGVRWCSISPYRWIADAWYILARSGGSFDWERFLRQARFHKVDLQVCRGLDFMGQVVPLNLATGVMKSLASGTYAAGARVRLVVQTRALPTGFLARARAFWPAIMEEANALEAMQERAGYRGGLSEKIIFPISFLIFLSRAGMRRCWQVIAGARG